MRVSQVEHHSIIYQNLSDKLTGFEDISNELIWEVARAYEAVMATEPECVADVVTKLRCMASHYEGGDVPASDVAAIADELGVLLSD